MKITRISDTTTQLRFLGFSNCYLVRESDGFTLIDTSVSGSARQILDVARTKRGEIRRILLTHAHGDHIGSLDKLVAELNTMGIHPAVAIGLRESRLLHKDLSLDPGEPQQKPGGSYPGADTQPTHLLTDGELFGSLCVFDTPGHTPGHQSFLDERDQTLFAGDALASIGGLRIVTDAPWYFPLPKIATWDDNLALESAKHLETLSPKTILCGHGDATENGTLELANALERYTLEHTA